MELSEVVIAGMNELPLSPLFEADGRAEHGGFAVALAAIQKQ
jgi:hypothetical protein